MTDFHKTGIGQMYYGKHVPEMIKELRRIADSLEKGNKMMMKEAKLTKKAGKVDEDKIKDIKELDKLEEKEKKEIKTNEGGHPTKKDADLSAVDE